MEFTVDMEPVGKARPRFMRNGHTYTDPKTKAAEKKIREAYLMALLKEGGHCFPKGTPVAVVVEAYFHIPKSYTIARRARCTSNEERPMKKPDGDNILKLVLDALNGVAYVDDVQVVEMTCRKYYVHYVDDVQGYLKINVFERKR